MKAAVYLRVSTLYQNEANQEPECLQICAARGWEPVVYRERVSGVKKRGEWDAVLESARRGAVQAVVFWALDRTGRTAVQICNDVQNLIRWNCRVVSVKDSWIDQPPGPMQNLQLQIMAGFAELERSKIVERTLSGQARARAEGKHVGRRGSIPPATMEYARKLKAANPTWSPGMIAKTLVAEGHPEIIPQTLGSAMTRTRKW